jgi:putative acetyltransferase
MNYFKRRVLSGWLLHKVMSIQSIGDVVSRSATNDDRERVFALVSAALEEHGLRPEPEEKDADLKDIEGNYIQRGGVFEVIEDQRGNLLGTVGLFPLNEETCELRKMYLTPAVRGLGLGRLMLSRMIAHARGAGFKRITLETASVLKIARRLYTRTGFVPFETTHLSARSDQSYVLELTGADSVPSAPTR